MAGREGSVAMARAVGVASPESWAISHTQQKTPHCGVSCRSVNLPAFAVSSVTGAPTGRTGSTRTMRGSPTGSAKRRRYARWRPHLDDAQCAVRHRPARRTNCSVSIFHSSPPVAEFKASMCAGAPNAMMGGGPSGPFSLALRNNTQSRTVLSKQRVFAGNWYPGIENAPLPRLIELDPDLITGASYRVLADPLGEAGSPPHHEHP